MKHESLYIAASEGKGRGVFTTEKIDQGVVVEIAPVIVMELSDRKLLDQTLLHDYIFEWGENKEQCAMALGWVPVYNHAYNSNCEYEMDFNEQTIIIKTMRDIEPGEELFINYNGDWDDAKPLWFDAK